MATNPRETGSDLRRQGDDRQATTDSRQTADKPSGGFPQVTEGRRIWVADRIPRYPPLVPTDDLPDVEPLVAAQKRVRDAEQALDQARQARDEAIRRWVAEHPGRYKRALARALDIDESVVRIASRDL